MRRRLAWARNGVTTPTDPAYPCSTTRRRSSATSASASGTFMAPPPRGRTTLPRTSIQRAAGGWGTMGPVGMGGGAAPAAIEMAVREADDVTVRAVMVAEVDDVLVAA